MDGLETWISVACAELGIDDVTGVDRALVLDLTRDVARVATRPEAVVAVYLFGVAVGRGMPAEEAADRLARVAARRRPRALDWRD